MEIKTAWDLAVTLGFILLLVVMVPMVVGAAALYVLGVCFGIGILTPWSAFIFGVVIIAWIVAWMVLT
jgi:hypothetical protein